jgi:hypothetical protein
MEKLDLGPDTLAADNPGLVSRVFTKVTFWNFAKVEILFESGFNFE